MTEKKLIFHKLADKIAGVSNHNEAVDLLIEEVYAEHKAAEEVAATEAETNTNQDK